MMKFFFIVILFLTFNLSLKAENVSVISYKKGNIPVIISVPHDGNRSISGLPVRKNNRRLKNFNTARDGQTRKIAEIVANRIQMITGKHPYVIISLLHRKYMDPNRKMGDGYEHPLGKKAYNDFHNMINLAVSDILRDYGRGVLIDIHGQTKYPADVYIGTRSGRTVKKLLKVYGKNAIYEKSSIGGYLVSKGYAVSEFTASFKTNWTGKRPGEFIKIITLPKKNPRQLNGGPIVYLHGSNRVSGVDALQVEIHRRIRKQKEKREKFAKDFADSIIKFMKKYKYLK